MALNVSKFRKPIVDDVPHMVTLINHFAEKGRLLPRAMSEMYECFKNFVVCEEEGRLLGCAESVERLREVSQISEL